MTTLKEIPNELAENIALALKGELKKICPVDTSTLRTSIQVKKDGSDYCIKMKDYWKEVEYLTNPFIRFTLNTKMPDILKKVTMKMSR